ncbi:hypothetical protein VNI00_010411 [Paramarasmius palmivorus]|uniref:Uncharacterized protein n=1 Tax=Paramarasmius palmivorus TaxID=297713 RepID=A0AAW0CL09_9AGAR
MVVVHLGLALALYIGSIIREEDSSHKPPPNPLDFPPVLLVNLPVPPVTPPVDAPELPEVDPDELLEPAAEPPVELPEPPEPPAKPLEIKFVGLLELAELLELPEPATPPIAVAIPEPPELLPKASVDVVRELVEVPIKSPVFPETPVESLELELVTLLGLAELVELPGTPDELLIPPVTPPGPVTEPKPPTTSRHAGNLFGTLAKGGRLDPLYLKVGQFFRSEETLVKAEKVPKAAGGRLGTSPERLLRRQTDRGPKIISYID